MTGITAQHWVALYQNVKYFTLNEAGAADMVQYHKIYIDCFYVKLKLYIYILNL